MEHAWLDSLSEDWVSQPGSVNSIAQLPSSDKKNKAHEYPSRIPRKTLDPIPNLAPANEHGDSYILGEHSVNDINISMQRLSMKARHEIKVFVSNGDESQAAPGSADGSVVHNTVHRSPSGRRIRQTPEWKRRLLQGDMQYGEQRDLFSSAAVGLQDMFKPPVTVEEDLPEEINESQEHHLEPTMPSSPPLCHRRSSIDLANEVDTFEEEGHEMPNEVTPSPSPRRSMRGIQYRLNIEDTAPTSTPPSMTMGQRGMLNQDQSILSVPSDAGINSRKVSGQSEIRHEDFSPILIGKHSDEAGTVEFTPIEVPANQLKQKLERLRINQMLLDPEINLEEAFDGEEVDTNELAQQAANINCRRGGRSQDGSFLYRGLSPDMGLGGDSSEMLPEESLQASTPKQFPTIRNDTMNFNRGFGASPSIPRAPFPSPEKAPNRPANSGGSPLKLFGPYDTFTNQTLLRRISQFEEGTSATPSKNSISPAPLRERQLSFDQDDEHARSPGSPDLPPLDESHLISEFGAGTLKDYEFTLGNETGVSNKENISPKPFPPRPSYTSQGLRESSPDDGSEIIVRRRRDKSRSVSAGTHSRVTSTSSQRRQPATHPQLTLENLGSPKRDVDSEGKRPRTSPVKDPTPKRRRTLHRSDIAFGRENLAGIDLGPSQRQPSQGERNQETLHSVFELADPRVLATRPILRPRISSGRAPLGEVVGEESVLRPKTAPNPTHWKDGSLQTEESLATDRKPSIRTQDFVDQAAQIMAMIRNQVRPHGLSSLEESEAEFARESSPTPSDDVRSESTTEPFSRPPSREGKPAVSRTPLRHDDPELLNRLKKYQEISDMGDVLSSLRSMGFVLEDSNADRPSGKSSLERANGWLRSPMATDGENVISDIPNIRITMNPAMAAATASPTREFPSDSSGRGTHRSYPTASSRGSESRRTIMPESVSHLIPDKVGSMRLDKTSNTWFKSKDGTREQEANVLPSDSSEDDPFASIPDLSVDLTKELQNLRLATTHKGEGALNIEVCESPSSPLANGPPARAFMTFSPDGHLSPNGSLAASRQLRSVSINSHSGSDLALSEELPPPVADSQETQPESQAASRRHMTISFSSPVASFIHEAHSEERDSQDDEDDEDTPVALDHKATVAAMRAQGQKSMNKSALKHPAQANGRGTARMPPRQLSDGDSEFVPRPVSRIDEQDEDSTVELPFHDQQLSVIGETSMVSHKTPNARRTSLSFIMNHTPGNQALSFLADDSAIIGQNVGKLSLSPLSEFTVNNSDQSFGFEVSYVMGRRHMETGDGAKKVLTMSIRNLVDKLSQVEPHEPYWEDLADLNLSGKNLSSLHMLDEFCGKVVTLDASGNTLAHLDGVPSTVRQLKVSQNMLTELTSWDHLWNLQYVDVSGNEIKSLSALKNLVHLRSVKADNNQLTSLDDLDCHDGLLSLTARDNLIEEIDFTMLKLERLTDLDLTGNKLRSIRKIELLPSLVRLKLGKNQLETLNFSSCIGALRQLDVSDNDLASLDVGNLPSLQSLYADRNLLTSLSGFSKCRRLDSLSLREQRGNGTLDLSFLAAAYEVRKLFLSGNFLGAFEPCVDFLNLQLLELANCGLQTLPEKLGQLMPNLRTLNLNFNAIANLAPLKFIPRLKKLFCAGNRLADSTVVTELLTDFPHLRQLDVRDNPVTLGFYAPIQVLVCKERKGPVDPFVLPDGDTARDELYAGRLDEATKLRRRLHQVVFTTSCRKLRTLDGLPVQRQTVLQKDAVLQTLLSEGLLPSLDEANAPASEPAQGIESVKESVKV